MSPDPPDAKKRKRSRRSDARNLRKKLQETEVRNEDANKELQKITDNFNVNECIAILVKGCGRGMNDLRSKSQSEPHPGPGQFAHLFVYQRTRNANQGERLAELFDQQLKDIQHSASQAKRAASREKWTSTILEEITRMVYRARDERYHSDYKDDWYAKRMERRPKSLNQITDSLHLFKGADAWVFPASLQASGVLVGDITKLSQDCIAKFEEDAVSILQKYEFEDMPDETPIFHFMAWLAWLLKYT